MKDLIGLLKMLFWISVVMFIAGGLLLRMHPMALIAGLGFIGLGHWTVLMAFKAADRALENRRRPKGGKAP